MRLAKGLAFILLFCLLFHYASGVLVNPDPNEGHRLFHWIHDFYDEPKDSLDAVFIGSSAVYGYWLSPVAYEKYGITVWPYSSGGQSLLLAQSIIQNVKRTQKNAVFIISTNGSWENMSNGAMHSLVDYLPRTAENLFLISDACQIEGRSFTEALPLFFPLAQFHSRWSTLQSEDFHYANNGLKGGSHYNDLLKGLSDVSATFGDVERREELSPKFISVVNSLLDYCSQDPDRYVFVTSPWCESEEIKAKVNAVNDMIQERGFPVVNLLACLAETGLDPQTDYYDSGHTNIHGALKVTDYLAQYLLDRYDFPEKSSEGGYERWDEAYDRYKQIITPYLTEEELRSLP